MSVDKGVGIKERVSNYFADRFINSEFVEKKTMEAKELDYPIHMMKGGILARAPDWLKLCFLRSPAAWALNAFTRWEYNNLGQWKVEKITEIAAEFDQARRVSCV